ncbi:YfbR-like 5'-deoxynucleotidase [Shewanella aestuarii]|uniref:HD domain-containing protein n=1 Tax=Shewanella aestuarii TaxID=1028752 RepID=A0A6G9QPV2_9GAMM|nr:YfbR-like 5'-deoxynucleotidase [Shewanella aestuarii]QIR16620.1 HD domain-containing protein [Shewanella aestuarii]
MKAAFNFEWFISEEIANVVGEENLARIALSQITEARETGDTQGELWIAINGSEHKGYWSLNIDEQEIDEDEDACSHESVASIEVNEPSPFMALSQRQIHLKRWPLMRGVTGEDNVLGHSASVAHIGLMMALIANKNGADFDLTEVLVYGLLHDLQEVVCQDVAQPSKNSSPELAAAFDAFEKKALKAMIGTLPTALQDFYTTHLSPSPEVKTLIKNADIYDALRKSQDECEAGNHKEFGLAYSRLQQEVKTRSETNTYLKEFHQTFGQAYSWSFDKLVAHSHI